MAAQIKKVKKRKFNYNGPIVLLFVLTFSLFLYTSIFVKNNTVTLNVQIQKVEREIAQTRIVNEAITLEIRELASYENVMKIAKESGLQNQQVNIVTLAEGQ